MIAVGEFANELPGQSQLSDVASWLHEEVEGKSSVDVFWDRVQEILSLGSDEFLRNSELGGRLLVLGTVAAAECYFRSIIGKTLAICPIARNAASKKNISISGLLWHGSNDVLRSAFDDTTFCGSDDVVKASKDFLDFKLGADVFEVCLQEYDKVCNLRHSIVHVDGLLPCKNAVRLAIPRHKKAMKICIGANQLQEVVSATSALVLLYNRHLFEEMCLRWAVRWRQRPDWTPDLDSKIFSEIWGIFISREQALRSSKKNFKTKAQCRAALKRTFGV